MAYCNRLETGSTIQDSRSRSMYKVKNVIRIMATFKKKKKKKRFFFECYSKDISARFQF